MNGQYPRFKISYFYEELTEHFLLASAELEFVRSCRGDANQQGLWAQLQPEDFRALTPLFYGHKLSR